MDFAWFCRSHADNTIEISLREFRAILDELVRVVAGCAILRVRIETDVTARFEIIPI